VSSSRYAGLTGPAACSAERFRSSCPGGREDDVGGGGWICSPCGVDGKWTHASARSEPAADELAVEQQRGSRASLGFGPMTLSDEWAVRDSDGRDVEHRAEVESEAGPAWMVSAGGVDKKDVKRLGKRADSGLQQLALA
jgi:hypothetical protein